jgi:hypothetical protein
MESLRIQFIHWIVLNRIRQRISVARIAGMTDGKHENAFGRLDGLHCETDHDDICETRLGLDANVIQAQPVPANIAAAALNTRCTVSSLPLVVRPFSRAF